MRRPTAAMSKADPLCLPHSTTSASCYHLVGRTDGFGAQLIASLTGIAYCRVCGCRYLHKPYRNMSFGREHNMRVLLPAINARVDAFMKNLGVSVVADVRQEHTRVGCANISAFVSTPSRQMNLRPEAFFDEASASWLRAAWLALEVRPRKCEMRAQAHRHAASTCVAGAAAGRVRAWSRQHSNARAPRLRRAPWDR